MLVISGTTRQLGLYRQLGLEPFGPRVGPAEGLAGLTGLVPVLHRSDALRPAGCLAA